MSQLQDTMYQEFPVVIRDVSAARFAVLSLQAPYNPGVKYRVDGAMYRWDGAAWVGEVTTKTNPVTGGVEFLLPGTVNAPVNGRRTIPLRIATFGDSTANVNSSVCAQDIITTTFAVHASNSQSPERWQLPTYYSQAYLVANGGIGGETTANMLARDTAAISASRKSISDVIDLQPHVTLLRAGSINNILGVTAGTLAATVATTYSEHVQIINRFLSAGIPVIDEGIIGTDGTGAADLPSCLSAIQQLNAMYAAYAATLPGKVYFQSWTGILADSTGLFYAGIAQQDGLGRHPGIYAQSKIAKAEAAILSVLFGASSGPRYQGANVLKNAAVAAANMKNNSAYALYTAAGGYGGIPTGFATGVANGARQNSRIEVYKGQNFYVVENLASAANSNLGLWLPLDTANFSPAIGDVYGLEFDVIIGGVSSVTPPLLNLLLAQFDFTCAGGNIQLSYQMASNGAVPDSGYFAIKVVIPPFQFPADTGALTAVEAYFQAGTTDVTTWKMGVAMPRLVKI